ncbi:hypothetical protein ACQPZJ_21470 [Actinoplanes sp. CA-054009]
MTKRIHVEPDLGRPPGPVTVYRAEGETSSRQLRDDLMRRAERWREHFGLRAEPADLGERIVYLSETAALEVYLASDSVWWTDRTRAYQEITSDRVPGDEQAVELARRFVAGTFEPRSELRTAHVGEQVASFSDGPDTEARSQRVGVAVTLRPTLDELEVFGPGAKVRIAFSDSEEPSDVAYFSRPVQPDGQVDVIHPYQAVERLTRDRRFTGVLEAGMELRIRRLELGYYSAGPSMSQRYLVPVYLAAGQVEGSELDADVFRLYLPAVDLSAKDMKELGVRANPAVVTSFTSF